MISQTVWVKCSKLALRISSEMGKLISIWHSIQFRNSTAINESRPNSSSGRSQSITSGSIPSNVPDLDRKILPTMFDRVSGSALRRSSADVASA